MKYFTLEQFLRSEIAQRKNIKAQYNPSEEVKTKLNKLVEHLLDPLYLEVQRQYPKGNAVLSITSGWRCEEVNKRAGGQKGSQHLSGEAADVELRIDGKEDNLALAKMILNVGFQFDQMILEYGTLSKPEWIHLSWDPDKTAQRNVILRVGYKDDQFQSYQTTKATVLNLK